MESLILLHNNLYPKSSYILMQNIQELLQKLQVPVEKSYNLSLEEKFLPFMERVKYYKKLFLLFLEAENHKILVCDSQSLLEIGRFFQTLYEETELREILLKECGAEVDILHRPSCHRWGRRRRRSGRCPRRSSTPRWAWSRTRFMRLTFLSFVIKSIVR